MPLSMHITGRDVAADILGDPTGGEIGWVVSIGERPEDAPGGLVRFAGLSLRLEFDDVEFAIHPAGYRGATAEDVARLIAFAQEVRDTAGMRVAGGLVHCGAGISRSSACTIVLAAVVLGAGREHEAVESALEARARATGEGWRPSHVGLRPNRRVVWLADCQLGRQGRLLAATEAAFSEAYRGDVFNPKSGQVAFLPPPGAGD